jgi:hypothetical protein
MCSTTHKTVKRIIEAHESGAARGEPVARERNTDAVMELVEQRVKGTSARISAKRLPEARAAGFTGSDRNFRRAVADAKAAWRRGHHRGRRRAQMNSSWAPSVSSMKSPALMMPSTSSRRSVSSSFIMSADIRHAHR